MVYFSCKSSSERGFPHSADRRKLVSKKVIVPSKFFRESVRAIYISALGKVGVKARDITVHLDSSATLQLRSSDDLGKVLTLEGAEQLSDFSKAGNVRVVIPAAVQFLSQNNPTVGTTTRKNTSLNPMTPERRAELD